jgi:hypothetical protein
MNFLVIAPGVCFTHFLQSWSGAGSVFNLSSTDMSPLCG